jgi:hypothetical protein
MYMAEKVSQTKNFENKYDNADLSADRTTKDIAAAYTQYDEMKAYKLYLETLALESKVAQSTDKIKSQVRKPDGTLDSVEIELKDLIPQQSEFEQARRRVLVKLNGISVANRGDAQMKQLFAEFETESIFELSSKITNYIFDKGRRDRVAGEFKFM